MNFIDELKWRGLIQDISDEKKFLAFAEAKGGLYIGFDPSFKSIHLGNYQTLMVLKRAVECGHKAYGLVGSITGMIGDPKPSIERQMQAKEVIEQNVVALTKQLSKYVKFDKFFSNIDFYANMKVWDFLRDIGKLVSVNYLLEKEVIARRLEHGISYAEFSYTLLQGYDFLHLYEEENVICQSGGSDQWGNIVTGLEMIRKSHGTDAKACCFSIPLLLKPDGTKFGKSEGGAIYLDPELTSPYTMYQFLLSQPDSMIETMLKRFTFLDEETIGKIIAEHKSEPSKFYGQKVLAKTVVTDIHGADEANKSIKISDALFSGNMSALSSDELYDALSGTNVFTATKKEYPTYELLVEAKICKSNSEARKLIEQKGISLNGKALDKNDTTITANNSIDNKFSYIKRGKKDYTLIKWFN